MTFDAVLAEVVARIERERNRIEGLHKAPGSCEKIKGANIRLVALKSLREWMLGELDRSLCEQAKVKEGIEG